MGSGIGLQQDRCQRTHEPAPDNSRNARASAKATLLAPTHGALSFRLDEESPARRHDFQRAQLRRSLLSLGAKCNRNAIPIQKLVRFWAERWLASPTKIGPVSSPMIRTMSAFGNLDMLVQTSHVGLLPLGPNEILGRRASREKEGSTNIDGGPRSIQATSRKH
jgi:hypothetical protein